jgi:hypothetical protein
MLFGTGCTLVKPVRLAKRLKDTLGEMLAVYGEDVSTPPGFAMD